VPFIEAPTTFYIGRRYDPTTRKLVDEVVYYDSRDLNTHAIVVGMTGSGKTGLCIDLLEEAALDNIPSIIIDPKGDITNLLLTFPSLRPEEFAPWINVDDARRAGLSLEEYTRDIAQQWRDGLASWSIVPQRISALKNAAQFSIYTPGSDAGLPVSILDSLRAPREGWTGFEESHRERISGIVTALLALIGKQVEPVRDREHVLISNIFENAWKNGRDLSLEDIILQVQKPPFAKLGVFDVDTFFPEKDRFKLAMDLNNIIASPSFQTWISGEPLDISRLLYTQEGRPRVSVFYIAHLTEAERTFMITLLLENMLAWMRTLSGTTSLRAILYFDEIFGHFPPGPRNPPTKEPLLRLLKQARAFGIGLILATQNPGDLDYKSLSNAGTWFIGKLQTENDKNRVLGGLQAASTAETKLNMENLSRLLSSLDPRVFVLHNVHDEGGPILMHSRWTMSYLRGPLTRQQVRVLMDPQRKALGLQAPAPGVAGTPLPAAAPTYAPTGFTSPQTSSPAMPTVQGGEPDLPRGSTPPPPHLPEGASSAPLAPFTPPPIPPGLPEAPDALPLTPTPPPTSPYDEPYPLTPTGVSTGSPSRGFTQPPPSTRGTSLTQAGPSLPEGYAERPTALPSSVPQHFLPTLITTQQAIREWEKKFGYEASSFGGAQLLYKPMLLAQLAVRYLDRKTGVEEDQRWSFHVPNVEKSGLIPWGEYQSTPVDPRQVSGEPFGEAFYGTLPSGLTDTKRMTALKAEVVDYVYRSATLTVFYNSTLDLYGGPRDTRRDFLLKVQQKAREARDNEIDVTTQKYDRELEKLDERLRKELRELTYDKQMLGQLKKEDLYTTGEAVLSLLRGRTTYTLSRMSRTRRYKTQAQERAVSSEHAVADLEQQIDTKQQELQRVLREINDKWARIATTVEEVKLTPYKKDVTLEIYGIGWIPNWYAVLNGQPMMLPAFTSKA
jgi:hypothetical protein